MITTHRLIEEIKKFNSLILLYTDNSEMEDFKSAIDFINPDCIISIYKCDFYGELPMHIRYSANFLTANIISLSESVVVTPHYWNIDIVEFLSSIRKLKINRILE